MTEKEPVLKKRFSVSGIVKICVKLLIAAALIFWIVCRDREKIIRALSCIGPGAAVAVFCLIAAQLVLSAKRWQWLLQTRDCGNLPFRKILMLTYQGCFANLFIPAGAVGGDVVKAALIAKQVPQEKKLEAAVSILTDRIAGMAGLFTLTLVMFLFLLPDIQQLNHILRTASFLIALACIAGLCAATVLFFQDCIFRWRPAAFLLGLADKLLRGIPSRIIQAVSVYRKNWHVLVLTTLFSAFVTHPLLIAGAVLPLYWTGETVPKVHHAVTAAAFGNTASAVPATPGGFGTRDMVSQEFLKAWGTEHGKASASVLIFSSMLLLNYLIGGIFFILPLKGEKK